MAQVELIMPKMGESIMEATILKWLKAVGDTIEMDESVLEIATDKVDSEVPSPVAGVLTKILFEEGETVDVGKAIAIIAAEGDEENDVPASDTSANTEVVEEEVVEQLTQPLVAASSNGNTTQLAASNGSRFYSPLVMNMARKEGIGMDVLERVAGTGKDGRVTKKDMLAFIKQGDFGAPTIETQKSTVVAQPALAAEAVKVSAYTHHGQTEIVEMDRMRKLIADHMVMSKRVSPHVTSFVEADVTNIVEWRNGIKNDFLKREGEKITVTPIFVEAVVNALKDFPGVNASVDGKNIVYKKDINIGIATALPSGNLIVPVVKQSDQLSLVGLTKQINSLVGKARSNKLKPDEIQNGTFTLTNVGTFGNLMGTPIINQPQVAILATGAIKKKPAVLETEHGDVIAIRHMMFLSLSYDHRIVDGALGGSFLRRIADNLENFDRNRTI